MIDREKVINGLEELSGFLFREYGKVKAEEANIYYDRFLTVDNVITLLKEQEAVEPIYNEEKYGDHLPRCGNCEKVLPNNAVYGKVNFCHYCGRAVK